MTHAIDLKEFRPDFRPAGDGKRSGPPSLRLVQPLAPVPAVPVLPTAAEPDVSDAGPAVAALPVTKAARRARVEAFVNGLPFLVLIVVSVAGFGAILQLAVQDHRLRALRLQDTVAMAGLWFCSLCYLINRYGASQRSPVARTGLQAAMSQQDGEARGGRHVTVLVPSYCEEPRVIRMTVLSAALAVYPARNIVVLVDDPVTDTVSVARSLEAVDGVRRDLAVPVERMRDQQRAFALRRRSGLFDPAREADLLSRNFHWLADWLDRYGQAFLAGGQPAFAHIDRYFMDAILWPLVGHYRKRAEAATSLRSAGAIEAAYADVSVAFCTDITTFQRKQFANLSHAANKAMNLNAYIALMGGRYRKRSQSGRGYLRAETGRRADLAVRRPDYILTLDADSVIKPEYLRNLAAVLEQDETLGVVQTPYLSFPDSTTCVERYAGATTDIQYLVHQGSSHFKAGFWVGANALIRFEALKAIETVDVQDGMPVPVFIQDRTVIEDTGSTIDLLAKGWGVSNYYAALARSATPADFGALCIQRKRWCNGGLIILGSLLRAMWIAPRGSFGLLGFVLRLHYLVSPVVGNICLFVLMVNSRPSLSFLFAMALAVLPYFLLYGLDLRRLGYRFGDLVAVSALNLLLLPVAFAGILESLVQLVTGRKTSFARTPKVEGRTVVPVFYFLFYGATLGFMGWIAAASVATGNLWAAVSPAANACLILYGLVRYIGLRNVLADCMAGFRRG